MKFQVGDNDTTGTNSYKLYIQLRNCIKIVICVHSKIPGNII